MSTRKKEAAKLLMAEMKKSLNPSQALTDLAIDATLKAVELERENEQLRKNMSPEEREEADRTIKKAKILEDLAGDGDIWGAQKIVKGWTTLGGDDDGSRN